MPVNPSTCEAEAGGSPVQGHPETLSQKKKTEIINYKWQNHRENQVRGKAREATSNINLVINKETQDCEIGTVGGNCAGEGE
jgi:hypothetical protein